MTTRLPLRDRPTPAPAPRPDIDDPYLTTQLITCIGNKRRLLPFLAEVFGEVRRRLGTERCRVVEPFAGSGAAARLLKSFATELHVNDIEPYAATLNRAFLANRSAVDVEALERAVGMLNARRHERLDPPGFVERHYAPRDAADIRPGERAFYTPANARIIDRVRRLIATDVREDLRVHCLAALLVRASIHTNTSGVFKGFHKKDGVGCFGGGGGDALPRILEDIRLDVPVFSPRECAVSVSCEDANAWVTRADLPDADVAYVDPPYNEHPYGSNYFMLNVIDGGGEPQIQDGVSGIVVGWNRSDYNSRPRAEAAIASLVASVRARFVVFSYSDEGIVPAERLDALLRSFGPVVRRETDYGAFRGSRSFENRSVRVREVAWILEKRA